MHISGRLVHNYFILLMQFVALRFIILSAICIVFSNQSNKKQPNLLANPTALKSVYNCFPSAEKTISAAHIANSCLE